MSYLFQVGKVKMVESSVMVGLVFDVRTQVSFDAGILLLMALNIDILTGQPFFRGMRSGAQPSSMNSCGRHGGDRRDFEIRFLSSCSL